MTRVYSSGDDSTTFTVPHDDHDDHNPTEPALLQLLTQLGVLLDIHIIERLASSLGDTRAQVLQKVSHGQMDLSGLGWSVILSAWRILL